jgi:glycosyl transferase family 25
MSGGEAALAQLSAWCINLDRRPDRWAHMMAEAQRAGIGIERLPAVDALDPDVAAAASKVAPTVAGLPMSAGAFACFASHRLAWQRLLDSGESHGLVLEDDLHLSPGIGRLMEGGWIPADADVVKLEAWGSRCHVARQPAATVDGREVCRLLSSHIGAGCYILSKSAAARLLDLTRAYRDPVDEILFNDELAWFPQATIYQVSPAPAVQGKRPNEGPAAAGWAESSILERFSAETEVLQPRQETSAERLMRRASEEVRALQLGTRYVVVPFA